MDIYKLPFFVIIINNAELNILMHLTVKECWLLQCNPLNETVDQKAGAFLSL